MGIKSVLITGGFGNLGSWLTDYLVNQGYLVSILAKTKRPILEFLNFDFIQCDLSNNEQCKNALVGKKFDLVIHAGSVNDTFIDNYPRLALEVNCWGTKNLLEALSSNPPFHFIYLSTFQVYGKYSGAISELTPIEARNDYGLTHYFAEGYIKQFGFNFKFPYTILRLTNSYGAPKDINSSKWYLILNDLAKSAYQKNVIRLSSNGQSPRDFIWMGDVCKIIEKLAIYGPTFDIFNLSSQNTFRMIDIAEFVQQAYSEFFGKFLPIEINSEDKSTFPNGLYVSSAKLRAIFDIETQNHFVSEVKNIFKLLKNYK